MTIKSADCTNNQLLVTYLPAVLYKGPVQYILHAIYLAKDTTQSIPDHYPIRNVLEKGLVPGPVSNQNKADEEAAAAIAFMQLPELTFS